MSRSHPNVPSVDQSDRMVPYNLRQSGPTPVQMLISTRGRKALIAARTLRRRCALCCSDSVS